MRSLLVVPAVLLVLLTGVPLLAHRDPARQALALRRAGLGWAGVVVLFTTAFVAAEAVQDPGGALGAGLAAAVVVPVVALVLLAFLRPGWATPLLVALTVLAVAGAAWQGVATAEVRAWQDAHGPVLAVATFAVAAGTSALGWHRPGTAGALLVVLGSVPLLALALADRHRDLLGASTAWLTAPAFVTGVVYLLAAAVGRRVRPAPPPADVGSSAPAAAHDGQAGASGVPR